MATAIYCLMASVIIFPVIALADYLIDLFVW